MSLGARPILLAAALLALPLTSALALRGPVSRHPRGPLGGGQLIDGECPPRYPRCIALTFDDGPDYRTTPRLLRLLAERRLRVTFFAVGHRLDGDDLFHRRNRETLVEASRQGHTIAAHGYRHIVLDGLRPERLSFELDRTDQLITATLGRRPALFRAPFGLLGSRRAIDAVFSRGYTPAYWMLDTHDWEVRDPRAVLRNFRAALDGHPRGGVVLQHDTRPWSVSAVPLILNELDRRNAALIARGEAPYRMVGLGAFYRPLGHEAPRGMPLSRRRRHAHAPTPQASPETPLAGPQGAVSGASPSAGGSASSGLQPEGPAQAATR